MCILIGSEESSISHNAHGHYWLLLMGYARAEPDVPSE